MAKKFILIFVLFSSVLSLFGKTLTRDTIDLSGLWNYRLLGAPANIPGEGEIMLPNTLDYAKKSEYVAEGQHTSQLRREFKFIGEATYLKEIEIPKEWDGKRIHLKLERTKPSSLIIDGAKIGSNSRISSPQGYVVTEWLSPGKHTLEIVINNADSIPPIVARSSHAVSESTQTNWNGILGKIILEATNPLHIQSINIKDKGIFADGAEKKDEKSIDDNNLSIPVSVTLSEPVSTSCRLVLSLNGQETGILNFSKGEKEAETCLIVSKEKLWTHRHPWLHNLTASLRDQSGKEIDTYEIQTGFRDFSTSGRYFTINDNPVFLRGTVNAAVFPLTAYAPTDLKSWIDYFNILKEYGFNHVRFHSWTPPEAAFEAADVTGLYLLNELPIWGELDRDLNFHNRFLREDLKGIMEAYSHHPSFIMFSPGNELWGDISLMGEYMKEAKNLNPRLLATYGSNLYLGMNGEIGGEDFVLSAKTSDDIESSLRGSVSYADSSTGGLFNSTYPNSEFNFEKATTDIKIPVISHEVGQYQSYPDFSEITEYTGVLKPDNLKVFKERAAEAGTLRKASDFTKASGKWSSKLYKAEQELALRSPGIAGYELFGLQDYPGQGTAIVGVLNSFMQSKGFINPTEWRESGDDLMIIAEFPKYSFVEGEMVELPLLTVNFTENPDTINSIRWTTGFDNGEMAVTPGQGVMETGNISFKIPIVSKPMKKTLNLSSSGVTNNYDFWIFPKNMPDIQNVIVTTDMNQALSRLEKGENVILCPDTATIADASIAPLFTPDFWNYRMFRTICDEMNLIPSPGTLGLLINERHPALAKFPTNNHTDWQWWPIVANSRPLIIDRLPKDFDPIVEVIDNVERNFRLALMLECNVGKGKLVILPVDLEKVTKYPEGKWLLQSIKEYIGSKDSKPTLTLTRQQVENLLTKPSSARLIKELRNETYSSFK